MHPRDLGRHMLKILREIILSIMIGIALSIPARAIIFGGTGQSIAPPPGMACLGDGNGATTCLGDGSASTTALGSGG